MVPEDDLADQLGEVGWKVDRAQIARIESGHRGLSLDEAITIVWTLGLPPALLWLPLGESSDIALAPNVDGVHPDLARKWVIGIEPACGNDQRTRMLRDWHEDMGVWWMHDRLSDAHEAVHAASRNVHAAEYVGDDSAIQEARLAHVKALRDLAHELERMRTAGVRPPEIHENTVEEMRLAGIDYDGPSYPGPAKDDE